MTQREQCSSTGGKNILDSSLPMLTVYFLCTSSSCLCLQLRSQQASLGEGSPCLSRVSCHEALSRGSASSARAFEGDGKCSRILETSLSFHPFLGTVSDGQGLEGKCTTSCGPEEVTEGQLEWDALHKPLKHLSLSLSGSSGSP